METPPQIVASEKAGIITFFRVDPIAAALMKAESLIIIPEKD
jgi:hypothetical protein